MSEERPVNDIARKRVLYDAPRADAVRIRRDVVYGQAGDTALTMDIYCPAEMASGDARPAVVIVAGYPDGGFEKFVGCRFKDMGSTVSWCTLIASTGLMAITYTNQEPVRDIETLLDFLGRSGASLGIDGRRIGVWASSGNVPLALWLLMAGRWEIGCAALCYGYMIDLDGGTAVGEAASSFRFANPGAGRSVDELRDDVALFIARAGSDEMPGLNESLDRFVVRALAGNLPLTLLNIPRAPHAFDLVYESRETRQAIARILSFLQHHLDPDGNSSPEVACS